MASKIKLEVVNKFKSLMIDEPEKIKKANNFLLISGRIGGKTTALVQKTYLNICKYRSLDVIILRANSSSMADSIFSELKKFFFKKLPQNVFSNMKFRGTPPLSIKTPWGNEIRFSGVGLGSTSGSNISRGKVTERPVSLIIFEETQEIFSGTGTADLLNHALATYARLLDDNVGKKIYAGNRDRNVNGKFNTWAKEKKKDETFNIIETNWLDIAHFLNRSTIQMIQTEQELNPKNYEYMYMGIPVGGEDLVYGSFAENAHVIKPPKHDEQNPRHFKVKYTNDIEHEEYVYRVFIGVDSANVRDKAAFVPIFQTNRNKLIVKTGDMLVHDPQKNGVIRNDEMAREHVYKWFNKLLYKYKLRGMNHDDFIFVVDGHNIDMAEQLRFHLGNMAEVIRFTKKDLQQTSDRVNNAFNSYILFIEEAGWVQLFDDPSEITAPAVLFNELQTVCWDESDPDKFNDSIPNDITDGIRYPVALYGDPENLFQSRD